MPNAVVLCFWREKRAGRERRKRERDLAQAAFIEREKEHAARWSVVWPPLLFRLFSFLSQTLFFALPASPVSSIEKAEERRGKRSRRRRGEKREGRRRRSDRRHLLRLGVSLAPLVQSLCFRPRFSTLWRSVRPRSARAGTATRRVPASEPVAGSREGQARVRGSCR